MDPATRLFLLALGCALAAACSRSAPAPQPLTIERTSPALGERTPPLLLNDAVTVYFSHDILPLSVTSDSVTMVDESGHQVPGTLRVAANWVTFQPEPPLSPELDDGSFRPGATYRLLVAGSPRPDAVRAADGRRLQAAATFVVRIAERTGAPPGLPAPLRPPAADLPLLLRTPDVPPQLPVDAPRLSLHFTQPLLPASVVAAAFEVTLLTLAPGRARVRTGLEELIPRRVRVVTSRFDQFPGSTVEIDLAPSSRQDGDVISVALRRGGPPLLDYAGNAPLSAETQVWSVVAGSSVALAEWPSAGDEVFVAGDALLPAFEVRDGAIRPRVRVEAGDGSLGVFRPVRDMTLRPGQPFDRGDGEVVVSRGAEFPFLAIDVPAGVVVRVDASAGPVRLLACGGVRIAGSLELSAAPQPLPTQRSLPMRQLAEAAPIVVVAAGDVEVGGRLRVLTPPPPDATCLLLATAGRLMLHGELPFQTMLAVESGGERNAIDGSRGQSVLFVTTFTYGVAPGADIPVRGSTPWRQLPVDRDGGVLRLIDTSPDLQITWQAAPAHSVRKGEPDLALGRISRSEQARDGETIATHAGGFVRIELAAQVRGGRPLPHVRELRLCER